MIIGGGLIGAAFKKKYISKKNTLIFASGVSNSSETNPLNFLREKKLLSDTLIKYPNKQIIYFSTILIDFKHTPYYEHKKEMEELLRKSSKNYLIFRIPQLIGDKGNNNNLINYLVDSIKNKKEFSVYGDVKRAIIDVDDIIDLVTYCEDKINCMVLNISGVEKLSVIDLSKKIGYILKVAPNIKIQEKTEDDGWTLLNSDIFKEFLHTLKIIPVGYTERVIKKYIKI
tara:strand:+ start:2669 stop:3352 length:684 start_codon:yes stop_codon:yes gene_type:complete